MIKVTEILPNGSYEDNDIVYSRPASNMTQILRLMSVSDFYIPSIGQLYCYRRINLDTLHESQSDYCNNFCRVKTADESINIRKVVTYMRMESHRINTIMKCCIAYVAAGTVDISFRNNYAYLFEHVMRRGEAPIMFADGVTRLCNWRNLSDRLLLYDFYHIALNTPPVALDYTMVQTGPGWTICYDTTPPSPKYIEPLEDESDYIKPIKTMPIQFKIIIDPDGIYHANLEHNMQHACEYGYVGIYNDQNNIYYIEYPDPMQPSQYNRWQFNHESLQWSVC
jgi:hypothetical protein